VLSRPTSENILSQTFEPNKENQTTSPDGNQKQNLIDQQRFHTAARLPKPEHNDQCRWCRWSGGPVVPVMPVMRDGKFVFTLYPTHSSLECRPWTTRDKEG
jgi:hypothetical protein